jgi:hypothetical protein
LDGPVGIVFSVIRKFWGKFISKIEIINEIGSILEINLFDNFEQGLWICLKYLKKS